MTETEPTDTTEPAGGAAIPSPELIEFRQLVLQEADAWAVANSADEAHNKEGEAAAMAVIGQLGDRIGELADQIFARAARSWTDLIECAEAARWWQDEQPDGSLAVLTGADRANAHLISAVLALAKQGTHARARA